MYVRVYLSAGLQCQLCHCFVSCKFSHADLRDLTQSVTKDRHIHIMMNGIPADHNITDIQFCVQGSGYSRVDNVGNAETICQDLCTKSSVYLADAAAHNDHICTV